MKLTGVIPVNHRGRIKERREDGYTYGIRAKVVT